MRVHSVRDVDYPIVANTAYHPAFLKIASRRISQSVPCYLTELVAKALENRAARTVYAVVFEANGQPIYVVQNLAKTHITTAFQRILRVTVA
jgi:hypothetical protein